MHCSRCGSNSVQIQTRPAKQIPLIGFVLAFGGLALMILGTVGLILGVLIGLVVGAIVRACTGNKDETVAVCQQCGNTWTVVQPLNASPAPIVASLESDTTDTPSGTGSSQGSVSSSTITIERRKSFTGAAVGFSVTIDGKQPLSFPNSSSVSLPICSGPHSISYAQQTGLGKKNRHGIIQFDASENTSYVLLFTFTEAGLDIWKSW